MPLRMYRLVFCHGVSHYMSEPGRLKWVDPFRENEPAWQVNQPVFNPPHIIDILL